MSIFNQNLNFIFIEKHVGDSLVDGKDSSGFWARQMTFDDVNFQEQMVQFLEKFSVGCGVEIDFCGKILSDTDRFSG
jgi:hypothetical protein